MTLRGSKKGQYCMARFDDKGPYAIWNIKCILGSDNIREAQCGIKNNSATLTEDQVRQIYCSNELYSILAHRYGTSLEVINEIHQRKTWCTVTENLVRGYHRRGPPTGTKKLADGYMRPDGTWNLSP
jgi:hypothetical protein